MKERPLNEYIDMEAYDVVTGEQHRKLQARVAALEEALREIAKARTFPIKTDEIARRALAHPEGEA